MFKYARLKGESQEAYYNLARAFHHMGNPCSNYDIMLHTLLHRTDSHCCELLQKSSYCSNAPFGNVAIIYYMASFCTFGPHFIDGLCYNSLCLQTNTSLCREAAINLSLIYRSSGNRTLARQLIHRYCTI